SFLFAVCVAHISQHVVQFSQAVPQGPTTLNVSLMNLDSLAGGYHVHILPIIPGSTDPCSNANILGHFNPFAWNISNSPAPGTGTVDQYELGDISGKFGMLNGLNQLKTEYMDPNIPLTGPYSVVGRSINELVNIPLSVFLSELQLYTGNPSELCCGRDIREAR
uniref:Superoxide dismutase copper/zinc binding domain-containing protein n=1 Tax=Mola mola TaxID=94237 RepID=A0A3Q3XRX0_MOLML